MKIFELLDLKPGQFRFAPHGDTMYKISVDGCVWRYEEAVLDWCEVGSSILADMIERPALIDGDGRAPNLLSLLLSLGYEWLAREENGSIYASSTQPRWREEDRAWVLLDGFTLEIGEQWPDLSSLFSAPGPNMDEWVKRIDTLLSPERVHEARLRSVNE